MTGRRVKPAVILSAALDRLLRTLVLTHETLQESTASHRKNRPEKRPPPVSHRLSVPTRLASFSPVPADQSHRVHRARQTLKDALTALGAGEYEAALNALDESLRLDPFDPRVHRHRGRILSWLGEIDDAEQAFLNALALDGKDSGTWFALGTLLESQGRLDDAIDAWIRAEDTASNSEQKVEIRGQLRRIQQGQEYA